MNEHNESLGTDKGQTTLSPLQCDLGAARSDQFTSKIELHHTNLGRIWNFSVFLDNGHILQQGLPLQCADLKDTVVLVIFPSHAGH